eukprot:2305033-Pyramimonas_sp.AAC.1
MESRAKKAAKKPEEGWSLVIEPLVSKVVFALTATPPQSSTTAPGHFLWHNSCGDNSGEPFVALPDGGKRELNPDEQILYDSRNFKRTKKGAVK